MVWTFSITLTKEVDFNQASPSYEVAMEISKGKEKAMVLIFYFAAKYLSNGKNGLTNPPKKYPASRYYLVQRNFQAELGLDFDWAMVSRFASGMMFGRATLLRDAC